ncbi:MAG TPA: nucleotidyltransferase domain-containing protein [Symbiobacteriaceae bacterium]|nr:nucleotidyltransferase domain-containing protein [Symbiobacteriaceae bacterium]
MDWEARLHELHIAQGPELAPQRGALLALLPKLTEDPRILSLELHGSLARGEGDAGSDIDLMVEAEPDRWPEFWAERRYWAALSGDVVIDLDHQWDAPTREFYHAAILANRVYVDLGFRRGQVPPGPGLVRIWQRPGAEEIPVTPAPAPLEIHPDRLEDTFAIFWCGSALGIKYLARGDYWNALEFMQSRRDLLLRAWRLVHKPEHVDWGWHTARKDLPAFMLERLATAVPRFDRREIADAFLVTADLMAEVGPELARLANVTYPQRGADAIHGWIREA